MAELANILVVSDLHFGEELLPGRTRSSAGAPSSSGRPRSATSSRYYAQRRRDGRPWQPRDRGRPVRLHVRRIDPATRERPAKTADERRFGLAAQHQDRRRAHARQSARPQPGAPAGRARALRGGVATRSTSSSATTTSSCSRPRYSAELHRQLARSRRRRARARAASASCRGSSTCPASPGSSTATSTTRGARSSSTCRRSIRRTATSSSTPTTPPCATSATAVPEIDPHGIESWSFWGYIHYAMSQGLRSAGRLWLGYGRFVGSLFRARRLHHSFKRRDRRRREHRDPAGRGRDARAASTSTRCRRSIACARTRSPRACAGSAACLMLDRFGLILGVAFVVLLLLVLAAARCGR